MLSTKSKFVSVIIAMMLVLSLTIPVFADDGVEPVEEPGIKETEVEETSSKFLDHPIVKLLAEFFFSFFNSESVFDGTGEGGGQEALLPEGNLDGDGGEGGEPEEQQNEGDGTGEDGDLGAPLEEEPAPVVPAEKIASMHGDDKLGFGVITKLIGIVECPGSGVTLDDLVAQFKDGIGLGELFEMYCKPEHIGVGQIRKELKELNPSEKTNNGKAKGKNK